MGKRDNRTCIICRQSYHFCPTCGEDAGKPSWYHIFDGQNCYDIYEVCTQYRDKVIDAETAYNLISKLDLSRIDYFSEGTRLQIEEMIRLHEEAAIKEVATKKVVAEKVAIEVTTENKKVESIKEVVKTTNNTNNYKKK